MRRKYYKVLSASLALSLCCFSTPTLAYAPQASPSKEIALTFDDGPYGAPTAQILNILESEHIPATFFLIGKNVNEYPSLAKREAADGDLIGNHTYDHAGNLASSTPVFFEADLNKDEQSIASTTGIRTTLFRPPYGKLSDMMRDVLNKEGYTIVMWNIDTRDWDFTNSPTSTIVNRVLSQAKANSIILLHDGRDTHIGYPRSNTIGALPILIADLKERGYTFVTVDKLLH